MRLQLRLSLSYLLVVALFGLVAGLTWIWYSGLPAYRQARHGVAQWLLDFQQRLDEKFAEGGTEAVTRHLQPLLPLPDTDLTLVTSEHKSVCVWGDPIATTAFYQMCRGNNHLQLDMPRPWVPRYKAVVWMPLHDRTGAVAGAAALSFPARLPPDIRGIMQAGFALSLLLGSLASLALASWLSRRIARPVEALSQAVQDLGQGDLDRRVEIRGQDELADLARYFNSTAESLQRNIEATRALEAGQRQFLADISHNLRTPLAAIQGWVEALQDGVVQDEEGVYLDKIHRQTRQVAQTVSRLLDLSRWQSADPLLQRREVPISVPLMEAVDAVAPAAEARQVTLTLEGELSAPVRVDPDRLRDVFQVLLENCVQHGGSGIAVRVTVRLQDGKVRVQVQDDGAGATNKPGLGLSIARRLVEAHGGEFLWESACGQGTRAEVVLAGA